MSNHFIFLNILLIATLSILFTKGGIIYKTVNMECLPNPAYIDNTTCRLKALSWNKAVSNMECDIVKPLRNVSVFWKNGANVYKPFLVNVTNNLCDILDKRNFPAYTLIVMNILKQVSNVNHSCPFTGRLIAKGLYLDEKFMPITPPLGLYKCVFHFQDGYPYEDIGTVILYIQAIEEQDLRPRKRRPSKTIF